MKKRPIARHNNRAPKPQHLSLLLPSDRASRFPSRFPFAEYRFELITPCCWLTTAVARVDGCWWYPAYRPSVWGFVAYGSCLFIFEVSSGWCSFCARRGLFSSYRGLEIVVILSVRSPRGMNFIFIYVHLLLLIKPFVGLRIFCFAE